MDCVTCANRGIGPATDDEFLGSLCNLKGNDGSNAVFPAIAGRYTLYVIAGCPFAARPWCVLAYYGLLDTVKVVKLFPASTDLGWFFEATSESEIALQDSFPSAQADQDPLGHNHLSEVYLKANPNFKGAISVPLLWDNENQTAVSNSSLGLAEMISTQLRSLATQHHRSDLFPCRFKSPELAQHHDALVKDLHSNVTTAVYAMNSSYGIKHDEMVDKYYAKLDELEDLLSRQKFLTSDADIRFADLVLFISLVRLDLAYQFRFGLGRKSIRDDYPALQAFVRRIHDLPGMSDTVLPRDIMALYYLTPKWSANGDGRTLPQVPMAWERALQSD